MSSNMPETKNMRLVYLPDCFFNVTNRLVVEAYNKQLKQIMPDITINTICDHVKRIVDDARGFRKTRADNVNLMGIYYLSKRHKYITKAIHDSIRLVSYLTFKDFYDEFTKINLDHTERDINIFTFPIDKFKIILGDNNEHPKRTTQFITIYRKVMNELDNIPVNYKTSGDAFVRVAIPNNPKIDQLYEICARYYRRTKNIRKYLHVFEKIIHQEIQDGATGPND